MVEHATDVAEAERTANRGGVRRALRGRRLRRDCAVGRRQTAVAARHPSARLRRGFARLFSSVMTTPAVASVTLHTARNWCATWRSISSGSIPPSRPSDCWQQHPMSFALYCSASRRLTRMRNIDEHIAAEALGRTGLLAFS